MPSSPNIGQRHKKTLMFLLSYHQYSYYSAYKGTCFVRYIKMREPKIDKNRYSLLCKPPLCDAINPNAVSEKQNGVSSHSFGVSISCNGVWFRWLQGFDFQNMKRSSKKGGKWLFFAYAKFSGRPDCNICFLCSFDKRTCGRDETNQRLRK